MNELYVVIAAFVVTALVDVVKYAGGWMDKITPKFPLWVRNTFPLWKLLAAIGVTVLVVWGSKKFAIELKNPLAVLILAQVVHEVRDAVKKTRANAEDTT